MLAACLAMFVTFIVGQPTLSGLRRLKLGKSADLDAPEVYASKAGTLTMGGVMFLASILVAALPFAVIENTDLLLPLLAMFVAAGLGAMHSRRCSDRR
jgi:phospho-N-acetylmuramoyl-pentapeptide-transferase